MPIQTDSRPCYATRYCPNPRSRLEAIAANETRATVLLVPWQRLAPKARIQTEACGNAPGFWETVTAALKARLTFSQLGRLDETRFQRLFPKGTPKFPGAMPQALNDTSPLALDTAGIVDAGLATLLGQKFSAQCVKIA